jgi:hypothetical protein
MGTLDMTASSFKFGAGICDSLFDEDNSFRAVTESKL